MSDLLYAVLLSIPFYFVWNYVAPIYFRAIPPHYRHLPFLHCAGLFVLIAIVNMVISSSRRD